MGDRVHKSIVNAKVNLLFYFLSLILAFFSRKIFLDCLGTEFIGLTGTLGNILGYLNLSELGITASIGYFLFKPLETKDHQKIGEILSLLGYLYWWIGGFILAGGIGVSLFFPLIFADASVSLPVIYFAFYSLLGSALIGYFINYRQQLLYSDQKGYLVAIYLQSANIAKTILQLILAYNYRNLYLWIGIEFLFSIIAQFGKRCDAIMSEQFYSFTFGFGYGICIIKLLFTIDINFNTDINLSVIPKRKYPI